MKKTRRRTPIEVRFAAKYHIDEETGCWLWTAYIPSSGYGHIGSPGEGYPILAHRFSYEHFVGPIPEGMQVDHLCRVRHCINPAHLEAVSLHENTMRSEAVTAKNARKTECKNGHRFDIANTYWNPDGKGRRCRECMRSDTRRWRAQQVTA